MANKRAAKSITPKDSFRYMFLISTAALYFELFLIRWASTEIRVFAFVQNLVLIACFLGFGVGCLRSNKPASILQSLGCLFMLAIIVGIPQFNTFLLTLSNLLTLTPDADLWGFVAISYSPVTFYFLSMLAVFLVAFMLLLVAYSMIPFGQLIGQYFNRSAHTIRTYTANLAGSLLGTWLLLGFAWFHLPPIYWVALAFFLTLCAVPYSRMNWKIGGVFFLITALLLLLNDGILTKEKNKGLVYWSPYQRLELLSQPQGGYSVSVNHSGYMTMADTTSANLNVHPAFAAALSHSVYDSPFAFAPSSPDVLIVGAGAGNDAAAALRNGASHVDAVEIDPVIYELGKKWHPDHPYDSDKVNVVIDDARNFLRYSQKRYDVIVFGLLDSHTGFSGYSNVRIDNYVYTKEAFAQARRLLKPDGILVLKFEVRAPWQWIGQRFYRTLTEVFGREPAVFQALSLPKWNIWGGTVYLESDGEELWKRAATPEMHSFIASHTPNFTRNIAEAPVSATDDWPYPYNRYQAIPRTYLTVSMTLLVIAFFMVRGTFSFAERRNWTPFLLGSGFLLMETQLISRLGLYFGSTWIVSAIAISTVLFMLVLANIFLEFYMKKPNLALFYVLLSIGLLANYFFPWETLPLSSWTIGVLLSIAYAISVFLAGIIFTSTFQQARQKSQCLGSNVLGAVGGGLLQNASFIVGLKALLPIAACCYFGAALFAISSRNGR